MKNALHFAKAKSHNRLDLDIFGICFLFGNLYIAFSLERPICTYRFHCRCVAIPYRHGNRPNDKTQEMFMRKMRHATCIKIALIDRYHCMQMYFEWSKHPPHLLHSRPTCAMCTGQTIVDGITTSTTDYTCIQNERTMPPERKFNATFGENSFPFFFFILSFFNCLPVRRM